MRIALIGPRHRGGSLPPYLDVFAASLRRHGHRVHQLGSSGVPYDPEHEAFWPTARIVDAAEKLLRTIDLSAYDLLSVHFGNLEIEQLLPALWQIRRRPPAVYHVHSLDWTLFAVHRPEPELRDAVERGIASMQGLVFFGEHARRQLTATVGGSIPHTTAWLPTTIPPNTGPSRTPAMATAIGVADERPLGSLYGYAAPWKDVSTLLAALRRLGRCLRVVLAGPFWDQPDQAGTDLRQAANRLTRQHGPEFTVLPEYLDAGSRRALVDASHFGLFVYRSQPTFQGSGAIADYLAHATPVIATDTANMAELVGDTGIVVPASDPVAVTDALYRLILDRQTRRRLEAAAQRRAHLFSAGHHAATCLRLYESVLTTRHTGATRWQTRQPCSSPATAKPTATSTRLSAAPPAAVASPTGDETRSSSSQSTCMAASAANPSTRSTPPHSAEPTKAPSSSPTS